MQVKREAFKAVLERVKPAITSSGSIQELKHVWWDGKSIFGFNGGLGIRADWRWDLPPGGVLASVLLGLIESTKAEELELTQTDAELTVKVGRSTTRLKVLPETSNPWPYTLSLKKADCMLELTEELASALRRAAIVKASTPKRVEHQGVVLFPSNGFLALYSTDSRALAEVRFKGKFDRSLSKLVLPHAYVQQLLKLDLPGKIHFLPDAIMAEAGKVQVCSNLLDNSEVWDLPKLVDDSLNEESVGIKLPEGWGEGLTRAAALAGPDEAALKLTVSAKSKELALTGRLAYGSLDERFPLAGKLAPGKITVGLEALRTLGREAAEFYITPGALILSGKNDEIFMIGSHEESEQ